MKGALKARDSLRLSTIRGLNSEIKNKEIDLRRDILDEEVLSLVASQIKKRKEAAAMFEKGGRNDLVQKELNELNTMEHYLPKMMDKKSIRELIQKFIKETGASGMADMGKVMPQIMKVGGGLIDGKTAQTIVGELLS